MEHETIKFRDPYMTAKGEVRASVGLRNLKTLWFNTGTRCNLSCDNCYIESNPKNDRLSFISKEDVKPYLDEIEDQNLPTKEIGFTGGEPFLNPHIIEILELSLERGFQVIVLTNAYRLNRYKENLKELNKKYGLQLLIRVSLDHHTAEIHEKERGVGTFAATLENMKWLADNKISLALAGRSLTEENQEQCAKNYKNLLLNYDIPLDTEDSRFMVVFPEMDLQKEVSEITNSCWSILKKSPNDIMCSSSRMVVKRKGQEKLKVLACTLLAYDTQFELGETLAESKKEVQLNHPFCAQFCVLGGSSCL